MTTTQTLDPSSHKIGITMPITGEQVSRILLRFFASARLGEGLNPTSRAAEYPFKLNIGWFGPPDSFQF